MSYHYSSNLLPVIQTQTTLLKKRIFTETDFESDCHDDDPKFYFTSHISKRPRRLLTPASVISLITEHSPTTTPSPTLSLSPEFPSFSHSPSFQNLSPSPPLRSDQDIQTDITNSFTASNSASATWTNELLVQVLASEIDDLIYSNDEQSLSLDAGQYQTFFSSYKQPFELDFYMRRLVQYVNCSNSVFVTMFVYLDRVQEKCKQLLATEMNCHRLVFTCLVLAVKFLEDEVHSNVYYARVGGLTVEEMNGLEIKLLGVLDWNLSVSPQAYAVYEDGMVQTAALLMGGNATFEDGAE